MERHRGSAYQRFANYCNERDIDENDAVIAMTVTCHIDNLHLIEKLGHSAGMLTHEPCNILQRAGVLNVGTGSGSSRVDWEKVRHYMSIGEKLRN